MDLTDVAHVIGGVLTAVASYVNPTLAIMLFASFIIYELDEGWRLSDAAYKDILEYMIGLYAGFITQSLTPLLIK